MWRNLTTQEPFVDLVLSVAPEAKLESLATALWLRHEGPSRKELDRWHGGPKVTGAIIKNARARLAEVAT